jgi:hypothetical protein
MPPLSSAVGAQKFTAWTARCRIEFHVSFPDSYSGGTVIFHSSNELLNGACLSTTNEVMTHDCMKDFVGAIAVVELVITPIGVPGTYCQTLRESARSIDRDEALIEKAPFERTIEVRHGSASDIQVFGYSQQKLGRGGKRKDGMRRRHAPWRLYRQDLFLDDGPDPFLTLHWKHTLSRIRLIDVIPVGATRFEGPSF